MKVKIDQTFTMVELKAKLEAQFPEYNVVARGTKVLVVGHGKVAGAQIMGGTKKSARVTEAFPTLGGQMLFALCIVILGVFIPFIVYITSMKPKQVKVRDNVAEFIRKEYGEGRLTGSTDLLDN